jgi:hypoxanthine phosphoribosyltransferase
MTERLPVTPLYTAEHIHKRVITMAEEVAAAMDFPEVMVVSLLKGSFMFTADLIRALHHAGMHPEIDFLGLRSYGNEMVSSKKVTITQDLSDDVAGRHVLIVDDILESGRTLAFARNLILARGALSVRIAVLMEKPNKRALSLDADFVGFVCPDQFVVGYGLDYANRYRELPFIGVLQHH